MAKGTRFINPSSPDYRIGQRSGGRSETLRIEQLAYAIDSTMGYLLTKLGNRIGPENWPGRQVFFGIEEEGAYGKRIYARDSATQKKVVNSNGDVPNPVRRAETDEIEKIMLIIASEARRQGANIWVE